MFGWVGLIGSIILIDLALSGDNAVVIGASASGLAKRQRILAIVLGGSGAIILRIFFAVIATFLLQLPLLQAIGSVILMYIAIRLLLDRSKTRRKSFSQMHGTSERSERGFLASLLTILVADVTMSLDNVLAVGALASGNIPILVIGLLFSVTFLLLGSALIAGLIGRLPWLLDLASLILAWTAANMLLNDLRLGPVFDRLPWTQIAIPAVALAIVLLADLYLWRQDSYQSATKH